MRRISEQAIDHALTGLDRLERDGEVEAVRRGFTSNVEVLVSLTEEDVHQIHTALAGRGDDRNGAESWRHLAAKFAKIEEVTKPLARIP